MRILAHIFVILWVLPPISSAAGINIPIQDGQEPPDLLSDTGIFKNKGSDLNPADGFQAYDIIHPLWVDFAQKQRWIYIPDGQKIGFSATESFKFPVGTILVKHFRMEISHNIYQNIETRILVKKEGAEKWIGYTYKWAGDDAKLVGAKESPTVTLQIDATALGGVRRQDFKIPNRTQCLQCHNSSVGYVRSVRTQQLNRLNGSTNQLEDWSKKGVFDKDIGQVSQYPAYAAIDDQTVPAEARVKSYWAVNCSHCHNLDPKAMCSFTGIDFRFDKVNVTDLVTDGILVLGSKESSEIFKRMSSTTPFERMPYIGSALRDEKALEVIGKWIDGL